MLRCAVPCALLPAAPRAHTRLAFRRLDAPVSCHPCPSLQCTIASEGTPSNAARAVEALARLASQLLHHNRVLVEVRALLIHVFSHACMC